MPINGVIQPEIVQMDDTLRLRKFDGSFDFALQWYQDPELVYLVDGVRVPYTPEKLERMYRYLDRTGELYFIEALRDNNFKPIGDVTFWQEDMPIVIGDAKYRGKGVGRKVITALVQRGKELGYDKLYVNEIYHYNEASKKCFQHAGFSVCGQTDTGVTLVYEMENEIE